MVRFNFGRIPQQRGIDGDYLFENVEKSQSKFGMWIG